MQQESEEGELMALLDSLKEDAQRMEDISIEAGYQIKGYSVRGKTQAQVNWAVAVALFHLLTVEIKRRESASTTQS